MKLSEAIEKEINIKCENAEEREQVISILNANGLSGFLMLDRDLDIGLFKEREYTSISSTTYGTYIHASDFISSNTTP